MTFYRTITIASLKMYFREPQALFWTFFFPLLLMIIFGLINFDSIGSVSIGITNEANNASSRALEDSLKSLSEGEANVLDIKYGDAEDLKGEVSAGNLDALVILPSDFGDSRGPATVQVLVNNINPQATEIARVVVNDVLDSFFIQFAEVPAEYTRSNAFLVDIQQTESTTAVSYRDYLVPAIAALAIMQTSIFGAVFSLIRFKSEGVLRRLQATPVGPLPLLVGQSISRLIVAVGQTYALLLLGVLIFDVSIGSGRGFVAWLELGVVAFIGALLFTAMALAISGRFRSENIAAPVANVLTLPMMFLSGVFFPRSVLPDWLGNISEYLPLSFLIDAMHTIAIRQGGIGDAWLEIVGMLVWAIVMFAIAVRIFKWE